MPRRPVLALLAGVAACSDAASDLARHGDTTVVRADAPPVWGDSVAVTTELSIGLADGDSLYVLGGIGDIAVGKDDAIIVHDPRANVLRLYDSSGRHLRTVARRGQGPGEQENVNGVETLSDGRIIARDRGNARLNIYAADGTTLDSWRVRTNIVGNAASALFVDDADRIYTWTALSEPGREPRSVYIRLSPDGRVVDTVPTPEWPAAPARYGILDPRPVSALHPNGFFVIGLSDRLEFDLRTGTQVIRIVRTGDRIRMGAEERAEWDAFQEALFRRDPAGIPGPVPEYKPAFKSILVGRDGRLWVHVHVPATRSPTPLTGDRPPGFPAQSWIEPIVYDVFESDGAYLGRVGFPDGTRPFVARGDRVWASTRGPSDEPIVMRFRVRPHQIGR